MKVIVEISNDDASFGIKVLKSLAFVKKIKPMSEASLALWEDLKEASEQVRMHKKGEIKLKSAQEVLNEL